jgi:hypothetical protein
LNLKDIGWQIAEKHSITLYRYPDFIIWDSRYSYEDFHNAEFSLHKRRMLWNIFKSIMIYRNESGEESPFDCSIVKATDVEQAFRDLSRLVQQSLPTIRRNYEKKRV